MIPDTWVLLDSQSTVSVFKNPVYLRNIRQSKDRLRVFTNGGTQISTIIGDTQAFETVWYNPESLANILSMAAVRKLCRITMDTAKEADIDVHRLDGSIMKFKEFESGLYYFDMKVSDNNSNKAVSVCTPPHFTFLETVAQNLTQFTPREIEGADKARALYRRLGYPAQKHFEHMLLNNFIHNCPVTTEDAKCALAIYGPSVPALKGKTVRKKSHHVPTLQPVSIPSTIIESNQNVTLCMDLF